VVGETIDLLSNIYHLKQICNILTFNAPR
jgi:hypothetical protein